VDLANRKTKNHGLGNQMTAMREEFEWWNGLQEPSVYVGYKQICLGTGNDLATFSTSRTK